MPDPQTFPPDRLEALERASLLLSPAGLYLKLDDEIRITVYNAAAGVTLEVRSRMLGIGGDVQVSRDQIVPSTNRAASTTLVSTDEGWLLGAEVMVAAGAPLIGQCFVVVEVVRGLTSNAQPYQVLAAAYVTAKQPMPFPAVPVASSLAGPGAIRSITGTNPAAGVEIVETVPTNARWRLIAMRAVLTTDGTVANRVPSVLLDDGANIFATIKHTSSIPASNTMEMYLGHHGLNTAPNGLGFFPLPNDALILLAGFRIRTSTALLAGGDDWGAPQMLVEEWIEGA